MKIAITGHRPSKLGNDYDLVSPLIKKIKAKLQDIIDELHPDYMISGMALGIDTLWALLAIENDIKLICAIPFVGQENVWAKKSKELYYDVLKKARYSEVVSRGGYSPMKLQIRNEWMVNSCDVLIAVWDGSTGGTFNCITYARKQNKTILYIDPNKITT